MPLKKGKSRKVIGSNITELVHKFKRSGKIGTSHPTSKKKATKQAVVIALKRAGKSKYGKSKSKQA